MSHCAYESNSAGSKWFLGLLSFGKGNLRFLVGVWGNVENLHVGEMNLRKKKVSLPYRQRLCLQFKKQKRFKGYNTETAIFL